MQDSQPYKRFLVFGYDTYDAGGGNADVVGSYDTLEEVQARKDIHDCDHYDVLDLQERKWVGR